MSKFADQLPEASMEEFQAFITEGCSLAKSSLQSALDGAFTSARVMALAVSMMRMAP